MFINANDASVEGEAALPLFIPPSSLSPSFRGLACTRSCALTLFCSLRETKRCHEHARERQAGLGCAVPPRISRCVPYLSSEDHLPPLFEVADCSCVLSALAQVARSTRSSCSRTFWPRAVRLPVRASPPVTRSKGAMRD